MKYFASFLAVFLIPVLLTAQEFEFNTLGEWDDDGYPDYLEESSDEVSKDFVNRFRIPYRQISFLKKRRMYLLHSWEKEQDSEM